MSGECYLGRCEYPGDGWAKLEVLAVWDPEHGWRELAREARKIRFPNEGMVYCGEPLIRTATQDSAWVFEAIENPRYGEWARERYKTYRVAPAIELLDLRSLGASENIRRAVVELGISLENPPTPEVAVRLSDDTYVLLNLTEQSEHAMRWQAIDIVPLRKLPILRFDRTVDAGGADGRLFLPPQPSHAAASEVVGVEDWSPDFDYLERLLKRTKRAEPLFSDHPSMAEIQQIIHKLRNASALSLDAEENILLRQRIDAFLQMLEGNFLSISAIIERLMEFPTVREALDAQLSELRDNTEKQLREELEPRIRAEIETALAAFQGQRDRELAELDAIQVKLEQAREELRKTSVARDKTRSLLISELKAAAPLTHDEGILDRLAEIAADHAIRIRTSLEHVAQGEEMATPPWLTVATHSARSIEQFEVPPTLTTAANKFSVENAALNALDVLARAAQVPVLFGPATQEMVRAYAFSITAGDLYRHRVDPTTIALDDLWRHPGTREPTAVAHAWRMAVTHPERSVLLAIDGLDIAPSEFWFDIWCDIVRSDQKPPNLIVLTTLSETAWLPSRKALEVYLAGTPLHLYPRDRSMGESLKSLLSIEPIAPTVLQGVKALAPNVDQRRMFAMAVIGQETRSENFLQRAFSVYAIALSTYGEEVAAELVCDFFGALSTSNKAHSDMPANGLIARSVDSLRKLLAART